MQQNDFLTKNFKSIYIILFFTGLALSFWYATHQIVYGDVTQMLNNGYRGFLFDSWSSYGNAASVVGNVPGSLLAFVVGGPLYIVDSPWAPMSFLIFLRAASFFLLDNIVKNIFDDKMRLVFLVMYWLNPWFLFENLLYNPSYLFFFSALHLWSAFKMRHTSSFMYSFLHILSIGMAMQLHYSWVILGAISTFLFYKNVIKINWFGVIFSFTLLLVSLIPYIQEFLNNSSIRQNNNDSGDRYIGWGGVHVYPVLKAFLYWLRYSSFIFTNKLIMGANFDWLTSIELLQQALKYLYQAILFAVGALSLWIAFKANKYFYFENRKGILQRLHTNIKDTQWIGIYLVGTLGGIFVSAVLSPIIFNYWHLFIIFPFALFPFLLYLNTLDSKKVNKYFVPVVIYLLFVNLIASIDSEKYSHNVSYVEQTNTYIQEIKRKSLEK